MGKSARCDLSETPLVLRSTLQYEGNRRRELNRRNWLSELCGTEDCSVLYCTVLYCIVLYCTVLYTIVLYCTVLYCTAKNYRTVPKLPYPWYLQYRNLPSLELLYN